MLTKKSQKNEEPLETTRKKKKVIAVAVEPSIEDQLNARKERNRTEQKWSYQSKTAADLLVALGDKDVTKSEREASLISRASAAMREARELHR